MVRLTECPDMTVDVYRGRKTTIQQQQLHGYLISLFAELQVRGGIEDNSKIFFLISHRKHKL